MLEQHRVDLGGIDVHAAGDDEVGGAVGEEEEAVLVDAADVAEGEVVASVGAVGLVRVAEVLEAGGAGALDPHEPLLAHGEGPALLVAHVEVGRIGLADGARLLLPRDRVDDGAGTLGGAVVLPHHRTPPVEHPLLHGHRTGRGAVERDLHRRRVVASLHVVGQGEEAVEHRRHDVGVGDLVALDERERLLGVPGVHVDGGDAAGERAPAARTRREPCGTAVR